MSEIMPTTGEVRERFIDGFPIDTWAVSRDECGQDFDRWKAEVERAAAARALEEAADEIFVQHVEFDVGRRMAFHRGADAVYDALRARAAEIRGEAS